MLFSPGSASSAVRSKSTCVIRTRGFLAGSEVGTINEPGELIGPDGVGGPSDSSVRSTDDEDEDEDTSDRAARRERATSRGGAENTHDAGSGDGMEESGTGPGL